MAEVVPEPVRIGGHATLAVAAGDDLADAGLPLMLDRHKSGSWGPRLPFAPYDTPSPARRIHASSQRPDLSDAHLEGRFAQRVNLSVPRSETVRAARG